MTTIRKIHANRLNAKKSSGPKTTKHLKSNALKHGFYAKTLTISEKLRKTFEQMVKDLRTQFSPSTPMQEQVFQHIVTAAWHAQLAAKIDNRQLEQQLLDPPKPEADSCEQSTELTQWWGASFHDTQRAIKFLEELAGEVSHTGRIRDEVKPEITRAFGPQFLDSLMEWQPLGFSAVLMADHIVKHRGLWGGKPPEPRSGPYDRIVLDPLQSVQMMKKLILQQAVTLRQIRILTQAKFAPVAADIPKAPPRHLSSAMRLLQRAVDWFDSIKEAGY